MASNKIELDIGGKYSAGEMFKQLNTDVKNTGKDLKDMGQAATSVASNIAGAFGGKLDGALKSSLGILTEMARGGIWGAMQAVANTTISYIAKKWTEAKEAAQKYADLCRTAVVDSMKSIGVNLQQTNNEIDATTTKAKDLLAVVNGQVASTAELKVHEINVKALQSITDDMTAATKTAVMATAALEQAEVKAAASIEQAANTTTNAQAGLDAARQKREAAENALAQAQQQRAMFEEKATAYGTGWLARYQQLQTMASQSIEELMATGLTLEQALQYRKGATLSLAQFEEEHKNEIGALNEVTKLETAAKTALEQAKRGEEQATNNLTLATQKEEVARASAADTVEQAKQKYYDANAALDVEIAQKAAANEQELKLQEVKAALIDVDIKYADWQGLITKALENGYSVATTVNLVKARYAQQLEENADQLKQQYMSKVNSQLTTEEKNYAKQMGLLAKAYEAGNSEETAINVIRARYKAAMEEEAKTMEEAAKYKRGGGGSGGHSTADLADAIKKGLEGVNVNTNVNAGGVGDGVDKSNEIITMSDLEREVRDDQRKARDHMDAVKQSSNAVKQYLKGNMSPEVAQKFGEKMKDLGWTKNDFETAAGKAIKSQLLSMSEQKKQATAVEDIAKAMKNMGLK